MSETTGNIKALLSAHLQGDPDAFSCLMDSFKDDLWGFLVNRVRSHHDAEDLFQEIYLKVYKNIPSLKEPERFRSWLFSIAMNALRSSFRKKKELPLDEEKPVVDTRSNLHHDLEREESLMTLRKCIQQLPERDREILLLDAMAELPQQEIATLMDLNLNTVKTIIRRAKIKLARLMAEADHDQ